VRRKQKKKPPGKLEAIVIGHFPNQKKRRNENGEELITKNLFKGISF